MAMGGENNGVSPAAISVQPTESQLESQPVSPGSSRKKRFSGIKLPSRQKSGSSQSQVTSPNSEMSDGTPSPEEYSRATIFNTRDRPSIYPADSYAVVGSGSMKRPQKSTSIDGRLWKNLPRMPSMPSMPELPYIPLMPSKSQSHADTSTRRQSLGAKRKSQNLERRHEVENESGQETVTQSEQPDSPEPNPQATQLAPLQQKLADIHEKHPNLKYMSKPILPIVTFPGQGTGKSSEFNQDAPLWSTQPFKLLYFAYFGLTVGLIFLPWFAISSIFKSQRPRQSWSWKRSTLVKLYRHGTRLTFRTYTSLSRDITKEVPHSKTVRAKFVWVDGLPDELIKGEVRATAKLQNLKPTRTCGFWYGERDGGGGVGQRATAGEKVVYHLHGGAYWIGTAHEKDVTSAVNMQVLRALDSIYHSRLPKKESLFNKFGSNEDAEGRPMPSPHPPNGGPALNNTESGGHGSGGHCKRAFSLDYRLCVPGKPHMGSYPAALLDSLAGYRYLVKECGFEPKNVILAGDSAGGNLALALCRYLRETKMEEMPGAMILLSPWADASRSHSGPTSAPNKNSTSYLNGDCDIISPSLAFRNTAVSALLGKLAAKETYVNPYLSSISLQLAPDKGGSGPNWGFEGFPRRIYVCTGSAELSYDQHLTLAYRLAAGTKIRIPIHRGDELSIDKDPYEMAARLSYPRPKDYEITLWPSAAQTPAGTPLLPPAGWDELRKKTSNISNGNGRAGLSNLNPNKLASTDWMNRLKVANGYGSNSPVENGESSDQGKDKSSNGVVKGGKDVDEEKGKNDNQTLSPSTSAAAAKDTKNEAGQGRKTNMVKEKDMEENANVTHQRDQDQKKEEEMTGDGEKQKGESEDAGEIASLRRSNQEHNQRQTSTNQMEEIKEGQKSKPQSLHLPEISYFDIGGEDRSVVLDECRDAVHDYTLFDWFEPERGQTWERIAKWIDEEV